MQPIKALSAEPSQRDLARVMLIDVRKRVKDLRARHAQAQGVVKENLSSGSRRPFGKPKLELSAPKLAAHFEAVETRRAAQRELTVLVPAMRMLSAGLDQNDSFGRRHSATLQRLGRHLSRHFEFAKVGVDGTDRFEFYAAGELLMNHAKFLTKVAPSVTALEERKEPGAAQLKRRKLALYAKIIDKMKMSPLEDELLRTALEVPACIKA